MTRKDFYRSKEWETFRKQIIAERTNEEGFVLCAECGEPILKKYDLIIHHINELTEDNVNDVMVSLNPDNVVCVHFKCHNKLHERFEFNKGTTKKKKEVYLVYGAPCSGKTTWVKENATENDLIVDIDSIWEMISINERHQKPDSLKSVVFEIRDKLYEIIKYRSGNWQNAYVIAGVPQKGERDRVIARLGAEKIFIDTDIHTCIERARNEQYIELIHNWFNKSQPD